MAWYGYLSAKYVTGCDIFHVRSGYGRYAMARARQEGALSLVDHSIADSDFVFAAYEEESRKWSGGKVAYPLSREAFKYVNQDLLEADHILVNSEFVKTTLVSAQRARAERISVLYLGVDTDVFSPSHADPNADNDGLFTILYVGTIDYRKGVLYLLEACKRLRLPNCRVILLGSMGDVPLEKYSGTFEHVPDVAWRDVPSWYRKASAFVFPSLAEGSARVNYEAMACGIPVVTTYEAGSPIRDGVEGFIVPARDSDALADRIARLHADPALRRQMGRAARVRMESEFTWQHYSAGLLTLYQRLGASSERDIASC
jgi:glycosyltransferase involved in cell wall biosynthesis